MRTKYFAFVLRMDNQREINRSLVSRDDFSPRKDRKPTYLFSAYTVSGIATAALIVSDLETTISIEFFLLLDFSNLFSLT